MAWRNQEQGQPSNNAQTSYGGNPQDQQLQPKQYSWRNYKGQNNADDQDIWDVTGGAALYGGADIFSLASRRLNRATGLDSFKDISDFFEEYKRDNPTYGPTKVTDTLDLITSPKALSSRLFGGAAYLGLGVLGTASAPALGLTFGAAYAIESQRAYEDALVTGATDDEASLTGNIVGLTNGALQVLQGRNIGAMFTSGARRMAAQAAVRDAIAGAKALGLTGEVASRAVLNDLVASKLSTGVAEPLKHVVKNSIYGVLQGTSGDLVPNLVYGRPVGDWGDFLDRRAQDVVGAATATAVFGFAGKAAEDSKKRENVARQQSMKELDVYARGQLINQFADKEAFKGDGGQLKLRAISTIMDARANVWAMQTGRMPEEYYPTRLMNEELLSTADAQFELKQPGDVLGYFSKLEDTLNNPEFTRGLGKNDVRADTLLKALQNPQVGIKKAEMQWTGVWEYLQGQGSNRVKWDDVRTVYNENRVNIVQLMKSDRLAAGYKEQQQAMDLEATERLKPIEQLSKQISKNVEDTIFYYNKSQKGQLSPQEQETYQKLGGEAQLLREKYSEVLKSYDEWRSSVKLPLDSNVVQHEPSNADAFEGEDLGRDYTETLVRFPQYEDKYAVEEGLPNRNKEIEMAPSQGHYDEKNIIVDVTHTTQDLALVDGKVMTVRRLVEIQSDWDQKARKKGYKDEEPDRKERDELWKQKQLLDSQTLDIARQVDELRARLHTDQDAPQESWDKLAHLEDVLKSKSEERKELQKKYTEMDGKPYNVNPQPFKEGAWVELGLKSFLMQAVQDGHEAVRLPTGREVADRWGTEGNVEFYDKVVAGTMLKLVRRYDKNAKVEQVEVATKPTGDPEVEEVPTGEKVSIIRLSPEYKQRLLSEGGYTLFQRKAMTGKDFADRFVSIDPSNARQFKAVRLNNGETYVYTRGQSHADMVKDGIAMGYFKPEQVKATGSVLIMHDLVGFSGDDAFVPEYTGQTAKINEKGSRENNIITEDIEPTDTVHVVDDKLFQTNKGSFTQFKDGSAFVRAFKDADFSTAIHELGHLFELDLPDADKSIIERWTGVKYDGSWMDGVADKDKVKALAQYNTPWEYARERFARGFEQYIREGRAPTSSLVSVFERFKKWMSEIYSKLRNSPVDVGITSEVRGVFDRLLADDTLDVKAARNKVIGLEDSLKILGVNVSTERVPKSLNDDQKKIFGELNAARKELKRAKESQLNPDDMSPTAKRQLTDSVIVSALSQEGDQDTDKRIKASSWLDPMRHFFIDRSARLRRTPMGAATVTALDDAESYRKTWRGMFEVQRRDLLIGLSEAEKSQLREGELKSTDGTGFFGFARRLMDTTAIPEGVQPEQVNPESWIGRFKKHMYDINLAMGKEAEKYGVLQTLYGVRQPYEQAIVQRMPRFPTDDMYKILKDPGGEAYRALASTLQHYNPKMTLRTIDEQLGRMVDIKKAGILEEARKIKYFPDHLMVNGKTMALFHTDPAHLAVQAVETQAERIGIIRQFGQQGLKNATQITLKDGSTRPFYKYVDRVAAALGVTPKWDENRQMQILSDHGWNEEAMTDDEGRPLPMKELRKLARASNQPDRPLVDEVLSAIDGATIDNFSNKFHDEKTGKDIIVYKRLNQLAKELGGIKLWDKEHTDTYPPEMFLGELKRRLRETPIDYVEAARKQHQMQGGFQSDFDTALALAQGVPVYFQANGPLWKATRFVSNIIGAAQTSTSVVANLPQTLVQVPALVGMKNFQQAMKEALTHYNFTESQMAALGAFTLPTLEWGGEAGDRLVAFSRNVGKALSKATGMEGISRWNNTVAAKAVDLWFDALSKHPDSISIGDTRTLKRLRLTDKEIEAVKAGQSTPEIRAKAVQSGVAVSQFVTEAPYRRGMVENIPLLKMLFAYSSYTMGTARATRELMGEWKDAKSQGDYANVIRKSTYMLLGTIGAGLTSQLLRDAVKGDVSRQATNDDDLLTKAGKAFLEAQFLGPVQRMVDPFRFDNGDTDKALISIMPQVAVIRDLINAGIGRGKFGEFGVGERFAEAAKKNTPLAKGFVNWFNNLAYPEQVEYRNTTASVANFKREWANKNDIQKGTVGESTLNPDYDLVYRAAVRGATEEATEKAKAYYTEKFEDYRTNPMKYLAAGKDPSDIVLELRSSLVQRSPLNLSPTMMALYLQGKGEQERTKAIQAHLAYIKTVETVAPK